MTYRLTFSSHPTNQVAGTAETLATTDTLARMIPAWNAALVANGAGMPRPGYSTTLHYCIDHTTGAAARGGVVAALHIIGRGTVQVVDAWVADAGADVARSHYAAMVEHLPVDWAPTAEADA